MKKTVLFGREISASGKPALFECDFTRSLCANYSSPYTHAQVSERLAEDQKFWLFVLQRDCCMCVVIAELGPDEFGHAKRSFFISLKGCSSRFFAIYKTVFENICV